MLNIADSVLENRVVLDSTNINEVHNQVSRYVANHDFKFVGGSSDFRAVLKRTNVNNIAINVLEYGCDVMVEPRAIRDFYLLHINMRGCCEILNEESSLMVNEHCAAICAPGKEYRFLWHKGSRAVAVQIPKESLMAYARDILRQPLIKNIDFNLAIDLGSKQGQSLLELVKYLLQDASLDEGLTAQLVTAKHLEEALVTTLLNMQPGNYQDAIRIRSNDNKILPSHVRKAEQYMIENLNRAVKISELAEIAGVTTRTLSSNFKHFLGNSPARYFLNMRLTKARNMLTEAGSERTVSSVAYELGFNHQSGFTAAYRALFNETPSETLSRAA